MDILLTAFDNFLKTMDWPFICGVVLLAYFFTKDSLVEPLPFKVKAVLQRIGKVYRVLFVGIAWGVSEYFLLGYNLENPEIRRIRINSLILSYFVATSFYELAIQKLLNLMERK